ncbi:MAG: hypothetical protein IT463_14585 [Planctomycetes bacterium]|nr:hypothetical protein [Planctomycetota bacterium]
MSNRRYRPPQHDASGAAPHPVPAQPQHAQRQATLPPAGPRSAADLAETLVAELEDLEVQRQVCRAQMAAHLRELEAQAAGGPDDGRQRWQVSPAVAQRACTNLLRIAQRRTEIAGQLADMAAADSESPPANPPQPRERPDPVARALECAEASLPSLTELGHRLVAHLQPATPAAQPGGTRQTAGP